MGKTYLNGNSYYKLSGLYLTSLDNAKAKSEWASISWLTSMYGLDLVGFSTDYLAKPSDESVVHLSDNNEQLEANKVYFPIYEESNLTLTAITQSLSAMGFGQMKYLSGENVVLDLKVTNEKASSESPFKISFNDDRFVGPDRITILLSCDSETELSIPAGNFRISMRMNGEDSLQDASNNFQIDENQQIVVESIALLPKSGLTESMLNYKLFVGGMKKLPVSVPDLDNKLLPFANYILNKGSTYAGINTRTLAPIKLNAVFRRDAYGLERYYSDLGWPVSDNSLSIYATRNDAKEFLTANYDYYFPDDKIAYKLETSITPISSGWYQFMFGTDDSAIMFLDDKIAAVAGYGDQTLTQVHQLLSLLSTNYDSSVSPIGCSPSEVLAFDSKNEKARFLYEHSFQDTSKTLTAVIVSAQTLENANDYGLVPDDVLNTGTFNSSIYFRTLNEEVNSSNVSCCVNPYDRSPWVWLDSNETYKCAVFHCDFEPPVSWTCLKLLFRYSPLEENAAVPNALETKPYDDVISSNVNSILTYGGYSNEFAGSTYEKIESDETVIGISSENVLVIGAPAVIANVDRNVEKMWQVFATVADNSLTLSNLENLYSNASYKHYAVFFKNSATSTSKNHRLYYNSMPIVVRQPNIGFK